MSAMSVLMPDWTLPRSAQSNVIVTSLLFQPSRFGAGVTPAVMTGRVVSMRIVAVNGVETFPAMSSQSEVNVSAGGLGVHAAPAAGGLVDAGARLGVVALEADARRRVVPAVFRRLGIDHGRHDR